MSADDKAPKVMGRKVSDEKKQTVTFAAFESEIDLFRRLSNDQQRPLSQWIRLKLLEAVARDEQNATRYVNSPSTPSDEKA